MSATTCRQVTESQASGHRPGLFRGLINRLRDWRRVWQEREALGRMDERDLQDLRLSRWDVEREIARHLWDI
jgi:uncharacterized protein YjiS (DUF1127 family)